MRFSPSAAVLTALILTNPVPAQETLADLLSAPAVQLSRPADRAGVVARMVEIENNRRQQARNRATSMGLPLRTVLPSGRVQEIADFDGDQPLYHTTHNVNAAISTGTNLLRISPHSLGGSGVTIGLWDGGSARVSHQEFGGRVTSKDRASAGDHATHVGGTMIAAGVNAAARGMASAATVDSYDWTNDSSEMTSRGASYAGEPGAIYLSNHSYSYITGWNYTGNASRLWEWWGNGTTATSIEQDFGRYNTYVRDQDALAYNAPYYLIFRSAGNERTDNPTTGANVGLSSSGTTVSYNPALHPAGDGTYRGGFETISFEALAKNVMTVGAVTDAVTSGLRDVSKAAVTSFSSWGPTDDGRIKPDVVANGYQLTSSLAGNNTSYGIYSGTSMSSPNACGSAALLIEQYARLFPGEAMPASTLKGLIIHTADDRGNSGPDYQYGWGLVNVRTAADTIRDHHDFPEKQRLSENQLSTSVTSRTLPFVWDGVSPISATLCWTDPPGTATNTSDFRSARLINNLNLKIIAPNGTEHFPYVMPFVGTWTQAAMSLPATTGINNTDNTEQVRIASPSATGTWQAVVSFSGSLTSGSQSYSLILSGSAAEEPPPLPLALSSVSPDSGYAGGPVTLDLTGTSLSADTAVKLTKTGQAEIAATSVQLIGSILRCQIDLTGAAAGTWNLVATNPDLETSTLPGAFTVIRAIWSENFDGTVAGWTSQATTGSNGWSRVGTQGQSPDSSYFAPAIVTKSTTNLTSPSIPIPAEATGMQLTFWHNYNLQNTKDAGRLEFSVDGGAWFDVTDSGSGAVFASNGYNTTVSATGKPSDRNEFERLQAWSGNSNGSIETIINLTNNAKYAGHNLRMRWRIATNNGTSSPGWYVDSIALLGNANTTNQPPQVTVAASTSSIASETDPDTTVYQVIRSTGTDLSVTATDDGGEAALTYTWSVTSGPATPVIFSENVSNAAKSTTAIFQTAGDYQISVSVTDAGGLAVTSAANVRVYQTEDSLVVSPFSATVQFGTAQQFRASLLDQFSTPMASQPASFGWAVSGGGTIGANGLFSATATGGPFVITADSGAFSNTASVSVAPAPASILLTNLRQSYDGNPKPVAVTTTPSSLLSSVTYNTLPDEPVNAGTYAVEANITDPNYQGTASGSLVIAKASQTIAFAPLATATFGDPPIALSATAASGLAVSYTSSDPSVATVSGGTLTIAGAGSTTITASQAGDSNHDAANDVPQLLTVNKAITTVTLSGLTQTYDGRPKQVTVATVPAVPAENINVTYGGSPDAPTDPGTYAVVATVDDPNYQGSASDSMVIEQDNSLASWKDKHFTESEQTAGLADVDEDPDFDSLSNLAEYALGADPWVFTLPLIPTLDGSGLTLTFTRPAGLPDVTYFVESSEELGTWSLIPLEVTVPGDPETVRARDSLSTGDPSKRFIRLRFETP